MIGDKVYLDHYRTTPVHEEVYQRMQPYFKEKFWLPAPFVSTGTEIGEMIEEAKGEILKSFNLKRGEILFTPGGTYANNMVIHGVLRDAEPESTRIITSEVCHISILNTYMYYKKKGIDVVFLKVDNEGYIDIEELKSQLTPHTKLVSITHVNHTIGTIQPVEEIIKTVKEYNENIAILLDSATAINSIPIDLSRLNVDFLTASGHKIYGPKGIGIIVARDTKKLKPIIFGNVDTSPYTPGADNIPGIVGIKEAIKLATVRREEYVKHTSELQKYLAERMEKEIPDIVLNGPPVGERAVDNINYSIRYVEGESVTLFLDFENIVVATGSACASSNLKVNYVLSAIGREHELAHGSLRITLGWDNSKDEIDTFVETLKPIVERLRSQSTLTRTQEV
ncbi:MAG: cysteine desulfurase [Synergistetes bacterium]|nr:cysteine desulfurase [Synergistota bacterium]